MQVTYKKLHSESSEFVPSFHTQLERHYFNLYFLDSCELCLSKYLTIPSFHHRTEDHFFFSQIKLSWNYATFFSLQLILEQYEFELNKYTNIWIFYFNECSYPSTSVGPGSLGAAESEGVESADVEAWLWDLTMHGYWCLQQVLDPCRWCDSAVCIY